MKILIAVVTCHKFRSRVDAQRETWVKDLQGGADLRFFLGEGGDAEWPDEVILPVRDDYRSLPQKCKLVFQWALDNGYDWCVKIDDDVYLRPERLLAAVPQTGDYVGRHRGPANGHPAPYCSGFCYWMSRKAMRARIDGGHIEDFNEDVTTGNVLMQAGIDGCHDNRYAVARSGRNVISHREGPRKGNRTIASCEYTPEGMVAVHKEFLTMRSGVGFVKLPDGTPFDRVDVLMKTFLRDGFMIRCAKGIEQSLPGARMIIVDDGLESRPKIGWYAGLRERGHLVQWMPFDSGYGAKSNKGGRVSDREYILRIADDFDMGSDEVRDSVLKMIDVLDSNPYVGIVSGRHNGTPYEGFVKETVREDGLKDMVATRVPQDAPRLKASGGTEYILCDYTVNFSLIRSDLFKSFKWDEKYKIGGDHLDLYMHCWKAGMKVAYAVGANVNQIPPFPKSEDKRYAQYRGRARHALPWTFERHGWASWTSFDGTKDTRASVAKWAKANQKSIMKATSNEIPAVGKYEIAADYIERPSVPHFDDTIPSDQEYQVEVYDLAKEVFDDNRFSSVIDLGCGNAEKLIARFPKEAITGIEVEPTLSWLRKNNPDHRWLSAEEAKGLNADLVICSDVIEHVEDPDAMLDIIHSMNPKMVVISTPDRGLIPRGLAGPPLNRHHVREWTKHEFGRYLSKRTTVLRLYISNAHQFTQVALCEGMDTRP